MTSIERNNLGIYDDVAAKWWSDDIRWVRTLKNLVPGRLGWFDRHIDWAGLGVLDLGCAGGFMAEALTFKGARVTGIDPASQAIEAARARAKSRWKAPFLMMLSPGWRNWGISRSPLPNPSVARKPFGSIGKMAY